MIKIHKWADVQSSQIGEESSVWQFSVILKGAVIGKNCNVNAHCFIENDVIIGDNVTVKCGVYLWDGMRIGSNVHLGPNATFTNHRYHRSKEYPPEYPVTTIEDFASIGAHAVILPGITIGTYSLIGAGAVVTKDVPPHTLWYGNPAVQRGYVCKCGTPLDDTMTCPACGWKYKL